MEEINKYIKDGRFTVIPRKEKNKLIIFDYLIERLKKGNKTHFTEKELNEWIKQYYDDYAILRRYLVDYGYLLRDNYGKVYQINQDK